MTPLVYLCIALAAALPATYGFMAVKEKIVVAAAVEVEKAKGIGICNARVSTIESTHNAKVTKGATEAARAAELVPDPPETDAELAALCKRSASCRSKGTF